jgi:hypothetical protein
MMGIVNEVTTDADDQSNENAKQRFLEWIRNAPDRGTGEMISWTREELYDRSAESE